MNPSRGILILDMLLHSLSATLRGFCPFFKRLKGKTTRLPTFFVLAGYLYNSYCKYGVFTPSLFRQLVMLYAQMYTILNISFETFEPVFSTVSVGYVNIPHIVMATIPFGEASFIEVGMGERSLMSFGRMVGTITSSLGSIPGAFL